MKQRINVCVDWDVWLFVRQQNLNVSELCNAALSALRSPINDKDEQDILSNNSEIENKIRALIEQKARNSVALAQIHADRQKKSDELLRMATMMNNIKEMRDVD